MFRGSLKDDQFIIFQFGDIIFKFPCTVIAHRAGLMIVGNNDGYKKHYYLRVDFKWSEETGLIWWNTNKFAKNEKYKNHNFRIYGRLILKKNSERTTSDENIIYSYIWEKTRRKKLPANSKLIGIIKEGSISVYDLPRYTGGGKADYRNIILQLNGIKDKKLRNVELECFSIHKDINLANFIELQMKPYTKNSIETKFKKSCSTGWFFEKNSYIRLTNLNFSDSIYFDEIYNEVNSQFESFVVPQDQPFIYNPQEN